MLKVFKETRFDLAYIEGIEEKKKEKLICQQFAMEHEQSMQMYPQAKYSVVMFHKEPVGRIYIHHGKKADRILQIGLLEKYRRMGIGRRIVAMAIEEAVKRGKTVRLQVAWFNQGAYLFYEKLGFKVIENKEVFYEMEYMP